MAKTPIGLGQFSGRVGGVVYAVQAGRQVVRAYQPVVSNPKSSAQSIQRAKGNLVGRISKITPWQILEGLGDNKFNRRSRFLRLLLQKTTAGQAAGDPNVFTAKLLPSDFTFAEGAVVPAYRLTTSTAGYGSVSTTVVPYGDAPAALKASQGVLVVAVIRQSTGGFENILYRFVSPTEIVDAGLSVQLLHPYEGGYTADFYYAVFSSLDGSALRTRTGELTGAGDSLSAILEVGSGVSPIVWSNSIYYASATFTPST